MGELMVRISLISIIGTIVLILGGCNVLDVFSETEDNILGATVYNNGVNCDTAGDCTPVPETDIDVTASIFSVKETTTEYDFNDRSDAQEWTSGSVNGGLNKWTQALNDGSGN